MNYLCSDTNIEETTPPEYEVASSAVTTNSRHGQAQRASATPRTRSSRTTHAPLTAIEAIDTDDVVAVDEKRIKEKRHEVKHRTKMQTSNVYLSWVYKDVVPEKWKKVVEEQIRLNVEPSGMVGGKTRTKEFSAADVELRTAVVLECVHSPAYFML